MAALAYLGMCVLSYRAYNRGGTSKSVFLKYPYLNSKLELLSISPARFVNDQIVELSSFFVAHIDEKFGEGS